MNEKLLSDSPDDYPPVPDSEQALMIPRDSRFSNSAAGMSSPAPIATGLSEAEAARRLQHFGKNCLEEKEVNMFLKFCGYFWGPMVSSLIPLSFALTVIIKLSCIIY
jgi:hypothetical protein